MDESDVLSEGSDGEDEAIRARLEAQMALSLGLADTGVDRAVAVSTPASSSRQKKEPRDPRPSSILAAGVAREASSSGDDSDDPSEGNGADADVNVDADDGLEEYDFCLFGGAGAPTKVVLEDDSRPTGDGGLDARRPRTFYLAKEASEEEKERYLYAAVTGDQVLERSRQRWWGMEYPWRVTHITTTVKTGPDGKRQVQSSGDDKAKRRRPGKKTRLAMRKKERTNKQQAEDAEKKAEAKEEHIKEKKKRMNRLKKMRKRAKSKDQKLAAKGAGDGEDETDSSD